MMSWMYRWISSVMLSTALIHPIHAIGEDDPPSSKKPRRQRSITTHEELGNLGLSAYAPPPEPKKPSAQNDTSLDANAVTDDGMDGNRNQNQQSTSSRKRRRGQNTRSQTETNNTKIDEKSLFGDLGLSADDAPTNGPATASTQPTSITGQALQQYTNQPQKVDLSGPLPDAALRLYDTQNKTYSGFGSLTQDALNEYMRMAATGQGINVSTSIAGDAYAEYMRGIAADKRYLMSSPIPAEAFLLHERPENLQNGVFRPLPSIARQAYDYYGNSTLGKATNMATSVNSVLGYFGTSIKDLGGSVLQGTGFENLTNIVTNPFATATGVMGATNDQSTIGSVIGAVAVARTLGVGASTDTPVSSSPDAAPPCNITYHHYAPRYSPKDIIR